MNSAWPSLRMPIQESGILCSNCVQHYMSTNRTAIRGETKLLYTGELTVWALLVQIVGREQELMSTAGLQSLGGGAGLAEVAWTESCTLCQVSLALVFS